MKLSSDIAAAEFFRSRNPRKVSRDHNVVPLVTRQERAYEQVTGLLIDAIHDDVASDIEWGLRLAFPGHMFTRFTKEAS